MAHGEIKSVPPVIAPLLFGSGTLFVCHIVLPDEARTGATAYGQTEKIRPVSIEKNPRLLHTLMGHQRC